MNKFKPITEFLKRNGFKKTDINNYTNNKCSVSIVTDDPNNVYYAISDNDGGMMYSKDINIYWLIGYLTYCGYIDKNYIQLNK